MRTTLVLIMTICCCILFSSCESKEFKAPKVSWRLEKQENSTVHIFCISNENTEALGNNWVIYYNQFLSEYQQTDGAPIKIEHLGGTYFKMYPAENYQPIQDSYEFVIPVGVVKNQKSFFPEGMYIVFLDEHSKESTPMNIDLEIENTELYNIDDPHLMYPNADRLYIQNNLFQNFPTLNEYDIIPSLKEAKLADGKYKFSNSINIVYDEDLESEANLFIKNLEDNYKCTVSKDGESKIILKTNPSKNLINKEHYTINVMKDGIYIDGASPHAVFNATQTLLAILGTNSLPLEISLSTINDYPDLLYRGQMLDVSRNFTTKENLLKLIDLLSSYKINKLHLHLTDDEGWRLEIPGIEELTTVGATRGHTTDEIDRLFPAYGSGWDSHAEGSLGSGYYTKSDFIEILQYAHARHIDVIPEVDFPGHSRAAIKATNARYNKYINTDKEKAEEFLLADFEDASVYNSAQDYSDNVMNVALESSYRFVEKVIDEIEKIYNEAGVKFTQIHLGGDEIPEGAWEKSPIAQMFMKENNFKTVQELKDYFIIQVSEILKKKNVQMLGWQEFMLRPDYSVNKNLRDRNILSYCWKTSVEGGANEVPYRLADAGYPIILSNVTNFYFDLAYNKSVGELGHNWGGFINEYISFDMLPYNIYKSVKISKKGEWIDTAKESKGKIQLRNSSREQIKGVQGQLWAETIRNYDMIEYHLFPKMYGLIERGWNASPIWQNDLNDDRYNVELVKYNAKIGLRELPRLANKNVNFRLSQVGIRVADGKLYCNSVYPNTEIRYTIDGTEPNPNSTLWNSQIDCDAKIIKAKQYYNGKESVTTTYYKK